MSLAEEIPLIAKPPYLKNMGWELEQDMLFGHEFSAVTRTDQCENKLFRFLKAAGVGLTLWRAQVKICCNLAK